ncbi:hypothetical protein [Streptococcus intermedius]|uniref:hypothetical protein n=1 Tax=Streptococcus intermedius TaxID=1338 RepID=UPI00065F8BD5|nr:hypothetical protein [Streptococcus intermedius]
MKTIFENQEVKLNRKNGSTVIVRNDGFSYIDAKSEKKNLNISFDKVSTILSLRYCNSNSSYNLIFRDKNGKNMAEFDTDTTIYNNGHNILETKAILLAFAARKLTKDFPNNLRDLDIILAFSMKEKEIRIASGIIYGSKHKISIEDIRRVQCVTNGTISNLALYKSDKKTFWDIPDMKVPCNEITLPLFEAIVTKNTGKGIDFSRGNGFDQKTSEFMIIRYMDANFFVNSDGSLDKEWQKQIYDRMSAYKYDLATLLEGVL